MLNVDIGAGEPFKVRLPKGGGVAEGDSVHLQATGVTIFPAGNGPIEIGEAAVPDPLR